MSSYRGSGYAVITDFSSSESDKVLVNGYDPISNYSLEYTNIVGSGTDDCLIKYNNDIIGIVQDNPGFKTSDIAFISWWPIWG